MTSTEQQLASECTESILRLLREYQSYKPGPLGPFMPALSGEIHGRVAAALAACARELRNSLEVIIAEWKVERDLKCVDCSRGLDLGRHGCHFEDYGEGESSAVGNCKAWPLSRRIKQLEAALAAGGK